MPVKTTDAQHLSAPTCCSDPHTGSKQRELNTGSDSAAEEDPTLPASGWRWNYRAMQTTALKYKHQGRRRASVAYTCVCYAGAWIGLQGCCLCLPCVRSEFESRFCQEGHLTQNGDQLKRVLKRYPDIQYLGSAPDSIDYRLKAAGL